MKQTKLNKKIKGFTVVELLVTMVLGAILLGYGLPPYREFMQRQKLSNEANNLIGDLNLARARAVKEGGSVILAASDITNWANGWFIYSDSNRDGTYVAADDELIRIKQAVSDGLTFAETTGITQIQFDSIGAAAVGSPFELTITHPELDQLVLNSAVVVSVGLSGMTSTL